MAFVKAFLIRRLKPILSSVLKEESIDESLITFESLGHLKLNNVELNPSLLDSLGMPMKLVTGKIATIHLQLSLYDVLHSPISIVIEGITIDVDMVDPDTISQHDRLVSALAGTDGIIKAADTDAVTKQRKRKEMESKPLKESKKQVHDKEESLVQDPGLVHRVLLSALRRLTDILTISVSDINICVNIPAKGSAAAQHVVLRVDSLGFQGVDGAGPAADVRLPLSMERTDGAIARKVLHINGIHTTIQQQKPNMNTGKAHRAMRSMGSLSPSRSVAQSRRSSLASPGPMHAAISKRRSEFTSGSLAALLESSSIAEDSSMRSLTPINTPLPAELVAETAPPFLEVPDLRAYVVVSEQRYPPLADLYQLTEHTFAAQGIHINEEILSALPREMDFPAGSKLSREFEDFQDNPLRVWCTVWKVPSHLKDIITEEQAKSRYAGLLKAASWSEVATSVLGLVTSKATSAADATLTKTRSMTAQEVQTELVDGPIVQWVHVMGLQSNAVVLALAKQVDEALPGILSPPIDCELSIPSVHLHANKTDVEAVLNLGSILGVAATPHITLSPEQRSSLDAFEQHEQMYKELWNARTSLTDEQRMLQLLLETAYARKQAAPQLAQWRAETEMANQPAKTFFQSLMQRILGSTTPSERADALSELQALLPSSETAAEFSEDVVPVGHLRRRTFVYEGQMFYYAPWLRIGAHIYEVSVGLDLQTIQGQGHSQLELTIADIHARALLDSAEFAAYGGVAVDRNAEEPPMGMRAQAEVLSLEGSIVSADGASHPIISVLDASDLSSQLLYCEYRQDRPHEDVHSIMCHSDGFLMTVFPELLEQLMHMSPAESPWIVPVEFEQAVVSVPTCMTLAETAAAEQGIIVPELPAYRFDIKIRCPVLVALSGLEGNSFAYVVDLGSVTSNASDTVLSCPWTASEPSRFADLPSMTVKVADFFIALVDDIDARGGIMYHNVMTSLSNEDAEYLLRPLALSVTAVSEPMDVSIVIRPVVAYLSSKIVRYALGLLNIYGMLDSYALPETPAPAASSAAPGSSEAQAMLPDLSWLPSMLRETFGSIFGSVPTCRASPDHPHPTMVARLFLESVDIVMRSREVFGSEDDAASQLEGIKPIGTLRMGALQVLATFEESCTAVDMQMQSLRFCDDIRWQLWHRLPAETKGQIDVAVASYCLDLLSLLPSRSDTAAFRARLSASHGGHPELLSAMEIGNVGVSMNRDCIQEVLRFITTATAVPFDERLDRIIGPKRRAAAAPPSTTPAAPPQAPPPTGATTPCPDVSIAVSLSRVILLLNTEVQVRRAAPQRNTVSVVRQEAITDIANEATGPLEFEAAAQRKGRSMQTRTSVTQSGDAQLLAAADALKLCSRYACSGGRYFYAGPLLVMSVQDLGVLLSVSSASANALMYVSSLNGGYGTAPTQYSQDVPDVYSMMWRDNKVTAFEVPQPATISPLQPLLGTALEQHTASSAYISKQTERTSQLQASSMVLLTYNATEAQQELGMVVDGLNMQLPMCAIGDLSNYFITGPFADGLVEMSYPVTALSGKDQQPSSKDQQPGDSRPSATSAPTATDTNEAVHPPVESASAGSGSGSFPECTISIRNVNIGAFVGVSVQSAGVVIQLPQLQISTVKGASAGDETAEKTSINLDLGVSIKFQSVQLTNNPQQALEDIISDLKLRVNMDATSSLVAKAQLDRFSIRVFPELIRFASIAGSTMGYSLQSAVALYLCKAFEQNDPPQILSRLKQVAEETGNSYQDSAQAAADSAATGSSAGLWPVHDVAFALDGISIDLLQESSDKALTQFSSITLDGLYVASRGTASALQPTVTIQSLTVSDTTCSKGYCDTLQWGSPNTTAFDFNLDVQVDEATGATERSDPARITPDKVFIPLTSPPLEAVPPPKMRGTGIVDIAPLFIHLNKLLTNMQAFTTQISTPLWEISNDDEVFIEPQSLEDQYRRSLIHEEAAAEYIRLLSSIDSDSGNEDVGIDIAISEIQIPLLSGLEWTALLIHLNVAGLFVGIPLDYTSRSSPTLGLSTAVRANIGLSSYGNVVCNMEVQKLRCGRHQMYQRGDRWFEYLLEEDCPTDAIRSWECCIAAEMRPALNLGDKQLPAVFPAFSRLQLSSSHSLAIRLGWRDALLVSTALRRVFPTEEQKPPQKQTSEQRQQEKQRKQKLHTIRPQLTAIVSENLRGTQIQETDTSLVLPSISSPTQLDATRVVALPPAATNQISDFGAVESVVSVVIPHIWVSVVNDIEGIDIQIAQITVEDMRASLIAFAAAGRLAGGVGLAVSADQYNLSKSAWEPMLERSSIKCRFLKPQPLPTAYCSVGPDGHVHAETGVYAEHNREFSMLDVKIPEIWKLFEYEDSVSGALPLRLAAAADAEPSESAGDKKPEDANKNFRKRLDEARQLKEQLKLDRTPEIPADDVKKIGMDINSLPADFLCRVIIKKPMCINVSHSLINGLLDSYSLFVERFGASDGDSIQDCDKHGETLHLCNYTDVHLRVEAPQDRSQSAPTGNGDHNMHEGNMFPDHLRVNEMEQSAGEGNGKSSLPQDRPAWQQVRAAGAVLYFSARKDDWFRGYMALTHETLYFWDVEPVPPQKFDSEGGSEPGEDWLRESCLFQWPLGATFAVRCRQANWLLRPPSPFQLQVVNTQTDEPCLHIALTSLADMMTWSALFGCNQSTSSLHVSQAIENACLTDSVREQASKLSTIKTVPTPSNPAGEGAAAESGTDLPPGAEVLSWISSWSLEGNSSSRAIAKLYYERNRDALAQISNNGGSSVSWSGKNRPRVQLQLPGGGSPLDIPADRAAVYFVPNANPFKAARNSAVSPKKRKAAKHNDKLCRIADGIVAEVAFVEGVKSLLVRSTVSIKNFLTVPLLLRFEAGDGNLIKEEHLMPGKTTFAPLQAVAGGFLRSAPCLPDPSAIASGTNWKAGELSERIPLADMSKDFEFAKNQSRLKTILTGPLGNPTGKLGVALPLKSSIMTPARPAGRAHGASLGELSMQTAGHRGPSGHVPEASLSNTGVEIITSPGGTVLDVEAFGTRVQKGSFESPVSAGVAPGVTSHGPSIFTYAAHIVRPAAVFDHKSLVADKDGKVEEIMETTDLGRDRVPKDSFTSRITFCPPVRVENLLPFDLRFKIFCDDATSATFFDLKAGDQQDVYLWDRHQSDGTESSNPTCISAMIRHPSYEHLGWSRLREEASDGKDDKKPFGIVQGMDLAEELESGMEAFLFFQGDAMQNRKLVRADNGLYIALERMFAGPDLTVASTTAAIAGPGASSEATVAQKEGVQLAQAQLRSMCSHIRVYAHYWLINKMDFPLLYAPEANKKEADKQFANKKTLTDEPAISASLVTREVTSMAAMEATSPQSSRDSDDSYLSELELYTPPPHLGDKDSQTLSIRPTSFHGSWSEGIAIKNSGTDQFVHIQTTDGFKVIFPADAPQPTKAPVSEIAMGVSIQNATGKFARSRIVSLAPQYLFANTSGVEAMVRQLASDSLKDPQAPEIPLPLISDAESPDFVPFHWAFQRGVKTVQLKLGNDGGHSLSLVGGSVGQDAGSAWDWSRAFQCNEGEYVLKMRKVLDGDHMPTIAVADKHQVRNPKQVSPCQATWLRVAVITRQATTFINILPHESLLPPQKRMVAYRVDNHTTLFKVSVRQKGTGPGLSEMVPCFGSCDVAPYPFALDQPDAGSKSLHLHVRACGIAGLLYCADGMVATALRDGDMASVCKTLVEDVALVGEDAPVGMRSRHNDSFGTWVWRNGAKTVPADAIGYNSSIRVDNLWPERLSTFPSKVRVKLYADASTGATKVLHVADGPEHVEETDRTFEGRGGSGAGSFRKVLKYLLDSLECLKQQESIGNNILYHLRMNNVDEEERFGVVESKYSPKAAGGKTRPVTNALWIQVVSGVQLPVADVTGASDPFCELTLEAYASNEGGQVEVIAKQKVQTPVCRATVDPVWNFKHEFHLDDPIWQRAFANECRLQLRVRAFDYDLHSAADLLGEFVVSIDTTGEAKEILYDRWYPLQDAKDSSLRPSGSIRIKHILSRDLWAAKQSNAEKLVSDLLAETQALKRRLAMRLSRIYAAGKHSKGGLLHAAEESTGGGPGSLHVAAPQEVQPRDAEKAISRSTMQVDERSEGRSVPNNPLPETDTSQNAAVSRDALKALNAERIAQNRRTGVGGVMDDFTDSLKTMAETAGADPDTQQPKKDVVKPERPDVGNDDTGSSLTGQSAEQVVAGTSTTTSSTKQPSKAKAGDPIVDMASIRGRAVGHQLQLSIVECSGAWPGAGLSSAPKVYATISAGKTIRRTLPATSSCSVRFDRRPLGMVLEDYGNMPNEETDTPLDIHERDRRGSLQSIQSDVSSEDIDDVQSVMDDDQSVGQGTSAASGRPNRKQMDGSQYTVALRHINTTEFFASVAESDRTKIALLGSNEWRLKAINKRDLGGLSFSEVLRVIQDVPADQPLHIDFVLSKVNNADEVPLTCQWEQIMDFGPHVPPPRPHQSYDAIVGQTVAGMPAADKKQSSSLSPNVPSYLCVALFARSATKVDEYPIVGGTLVGAEAAAGFGPYTKSPEAESEASTMAAMRFANEAASTAKMVAGVGVKAGKSIARRVVSRRNRRRKQPDVRNTTFADLLGLSKEKEDEGSIVQADFREHVRLGLPTGCMADSDRLMAVRDFIPIPMQGEVIDEWIELDTVSQIYERAQAQKRASRQAPEAGICGRFCGAFAFRGNRQVDDERVDESTETMLVMPPKERPRIRIRAQWVPMYACKAALRSSRIQFGMTALGLSIVDQVPKELLFVSMQGMFIDLSIYHAGRIALDVGIKKFLINNQIPGTAHPAMIAPALSQTGQDATQGDAVGLHIVLENHPTILYISDMSIRLLRMSVNVDDELFYHLLQFLTSLQLGSASEEDRENNVDHMLKRKAQGQESSDQLTTTGVDWLFEQGRFSSTHARARLYDMPALSRRGNVATSMAQMQSDTKVYFGMLRLHPIAFDVTFTLGDTKLLSELIPDVGIFVILKAFLQSFAVMLANIEHAPITLNALYSTHVFENNTMLVHRLARHYIQQMLFQVYKILGSASFLGNPLGLVSGMGRDVVNLFYEPGSGLLESPMTAGVALASSATALVRNTTVGVLDSVSQVIGTASKGIKSIHAVASNADSTGPPVGAGSQQPAHAVDGVKRGTTTLAHAVLDGAIGIVADPIRGARRGGLLGAAKGLGSGIVGIITKPTAGVLDLAVLTLRGAAASANPANQVGVRARLPRYMGVDGRLVRYSAREAEGHARLYLLQQANTKAKDQAYVFHAYIRAFARGKSKTALHSDTVRAAVGGCLVPQEGGIKLSSQGEAAVRQLLYNFVTGAGGSAVTNIHSAGTALNEVTVPPAEEDVTHTEPSTAQSGGSAPGSSADHRGIHIKSGRRKMLGVRMPVKPFTRTPDVLRATEHERESCPYVILVTTTMVWLLHARSNVKLWSAEINVKGLQTKGHDNRVTAVLRARGETDAPPRADVTGSGDGSFGTTRKGELECIPMLQAQPRGPVCVLAPLRTEKDVVVLLCDDANGTTTLVKAITDLQHNFVDRSGLLTLESAADRQQSKTDHIAGEAASWQRVSRSIHLRSSKVQLALAAHCIDHIRIVSCDPTGMLLMSDPAHMGSGSAFSFETQIRAVDGQTRMIRSSRSLSAIRQLMQRIPWANPLLDTCAAPRSNPSISEVQECMDFVKTQLQREGPLQVQHHNEAIDPFDFTNILRELLLLLNVSTSDLGIADAIDIGKGNYTVPSSGFIDVALDTLGTTPVELVQSEVVSSMAESSVYLQPDTTLIQEAK